MRYAAVPAKFGKWVFGAGVKLLGNGGSTTASPNLEMRDNDQGIWKNWNINDGAALEDQATGFVVQQVEEFETARSRDD